MRLLILILLVLVPCLALAQIDRDRLLAVIPLVEGATATTIGRAGERGPWQLTAAVWHQHSNRPFWWASSSLPNHQEEGWRVAFAHVAWLEAQVERPTLYRIALAWNAGVGAVNRCRVTDAQAGYAARVRNLAEEAP